jgi:hypothetical protein
MVLLLHARVVLMIMRAHVGACRMMWGKVTAF